MTTLPALVVNESTSSFDYSALDHAVAAEALATAARIRRRIDDSHLDTGRDLLTIRAKLPHGEFCRWIGAEFNMSERTARNLMSLAEYAKANPEMIADLPVTAIYRLAAPSTPKSVREEFKQRVVKGERPTVRVIEDRIVEAKDEQAKEVAKARDLKASSKGRSAKEIKASERLEEVQAARERREREETERLLAERQKAAQEAITLLRERLGYDLLRFTHLCRRAEGVFGAALAELINNSKVIVAEDDRDLPETAVAEADHGVTEEVTAEDAHDPTEEVVVEVHYGFVEEIVDEVDHGFIEEVVADADHGFVEEIVDEVDHGFIEEVVAEMVVEEGSYDPAKLTELDLSDAA